MATVDISKGTLLGRKLRHCPGRKPYVAPPGLLRAANTAMLLEWPLLLSGEPGCGKSDFAWAAASALASLQRGATPESIEGAVPLQFYVRSETRARDLLYSYDALRRFGDTQYGQKERAAEARHYVTLEALGEALMRPQLSVVLIDEIDKAPRDLPNDLLRELEQGDFQIPEVPEDRVGAAVNRTMKRPRDTPLPLIVITSNNERQLPDPFLRRCVFYHIPFPREAQMKDIVRSHFQGEPPPDDALWTFASRIFYALRDKLPLQKRPSTVEFLGWLRALMADGSAGLRTRLDSIAQRITPDTAAAELTALPFFPSTESSSAAPDDPLCLGCLLKLKDDLRLLGMPA